MSELLSFAPSTPQVKTNLEPWKVLVVDDEPAIHQVTKIALSDLVLEGRKLLFLNALSGQESKAILRDHDDIAMILLDVIMETELAGLDLVKWIRNELGNKLVRIVLRTGQPGIAPEEKIILEYDINDYKEKTELVRSKLFSTTCAALRNYRELKNLNDAHEKEQQFRRGLEQVAGATSHLFDHEGLNEFANGLLTQVGVLLHLNNNNLMVKVNALNAFLNNGQYQVLASSGRFKSNTTILDPEIKSQLDDVLIKKRHVQKGNAFIGYFPMTRGDVNLVYFEDVNSLDTLDLQLLDLFGLNVSSAMQRLVHLHRNRLSFNELILKLSQQINEFNKGESKTTRDVVKLCNYLAGAVNLSHDEQVLFSSLVPLYDIGLSLLPSDLLKKQGTYTNDEREIMKSHAHKGKSLLEAHNDPVLQYAAQIAFEHHERFDGSGYPQGISSRETALASQIVGIADTFIALTSDRPYRSAWSRDQATEYLKEQSGKQFSPDLVDIFVESKSAIDALLR